MDVQNDSERVTHINVHKGRGGQSNDYMITGGRGGSKRGQNLIT